MKFGDMFPNNFLKKEDLNGPTTATIAKITIEEIKGDSGNEQKAVVHFFGTLKPMVLNKGNGYTLKEAYGEDSDAWIGKSVELYVDPNVMFAGKRVGGLRLRLPSSNGHQAHAAKLTWEQAQARAAEVGIAKDDLIARLKARGKAAYNADKDTQTVLEIISEKKAGPGDSFEGPTHGEEIPF